MRNEIEKLVENLRETESEIKNLKDSLTNLLENEDFQKFYSPEEAKKRKKKEYNQKYYNKNK